jgi:hypothetical protein
MASARTFKVGPRALLAGDGGLLTAGLVGFIMGLASLDAGLPAVFGLAVVLLGPLLAWLLRGRVVDGTATLGAVLGFIAGTVVVIAVLTALGLVTGVLGLEGTFGLSQDNLPVALVALVAVPYLAVAGLLDVDALRDLSRRRREHVWLDICRLLATVAYVALIVGVIVWTTGSPSPLTDRVPVFFSLVGPGALGAAAATGADLLVRRHERRSRGHLVSGA